MSLDLESGWEDEAEGGGNSTGSMISSMNSRQIRQFRQHGLSAEAFNTQAESHVVIGNFTVPLQLTLLLFHALCVNPPEASQPAATPRLLRLLAGHGYSCAFWSRLSTWKTEIMYKLAGFQAKEKSSERDVANSLRALPSKLLLVHLFLTVAMMSVLAGVFSSPQANPYSSESGFIGNIADAVLLFLGGLLLFWIITHVRKGVFVVYDTARRQHEFRVWAGERFGRCIVVQLYVCAKAMTW